MTNREGQCCGDLKRLLCICNLTCYTHTVIRSFRHEGLDELFRKRRSRRVPTALKIRALRRLDALNQAATLRDLNIPGFDFYPLKGKPRRYSVHINGPWCITFEWREGGAEQVDLENYH